MLWCKFIQKSFSTDVMLKMKSWYSVTTAVILVVNYINGGCAVSKLIYNTITFNWVNGVYPIYKDRGWKITNNITQFTVIE